MKIEGVRSQATIYLQQALNLGKNGEVKTHLSQILQNNYFEVKIHLRLKSKQVNDYSRQTNYLVVQFLFSIFHILKVIRFCRGVEFSRDARDVSLPISNDTDISLAIILIKT